MNSQVHILQVDRLSAGYGQRTVLQNVTFSLNQGEVLAIIGQNGSGKSTLLKAVAGLVHITSGTVMYRG
ncbi:MAG: ABC transporter ATP-binding protein, partial [Pelodictyon phaeoclathratiforme]